MQMVQPLALVKLHVLTNREVKADTETYSGYEAGGSAG